MASKLANYIEGGRTLDADEREFAALALRQVDEAERAGIDTALGRDGRPPARRAMSGREKPVSGRKTIAIARARIHSVCAPIR